MNTLYVLYDHACPFTVHHCEWLALQATLVGLRLLPNRAEEILNRFPGIEPHLRPRALTAVSEHGQIWTGPAAAVMCLYATTKYRELAERLAHPTLFPYAHTALELLSREVFEVTRLLERSTYAELAEVLRLNSNVVQQHFGLPNSQVWPPARGGAR